MSRHGTCNSGVDGIFKQLAENISRKIEEVLTYMVTMGADYIRPYLNFYTTHPTISNDHRLMTHFKDYIGALDGTHISTTPRP